MAYTVHYTTPSGPTSEQHDIGVRAAERAMTFSGMGAANVYVEAADGTVFRAPIEMSALIEHAKPTDTGRT
ncbi:hypothetical protein MOX02_56390 [Methylobacterium oxalidis]|uniref:Uncharacterized protein n=1 Tax=Methylobacterium oxalidis TaxID=944322 RepID=A0A512JCE9_9HYPH|nr:hypothetical protein MOX02_56390 [Methylobacterium oxalidis]GJE33467.1 hypothetical protein LDDCCGHA_3667 [Methylobacterium oxalidis]GLS66186.1 hypothetical protein GCM10007888_45680 [Methylobacterium oxalidis]